jgi:hypothetical protein
MVIYETGMSYPEHAAVLMEMAGLAQRFNLLVMINLTPEDQARVKRFQTAMYRDMVANGHTFQPSNVNRLHITALRGIQGSELTRQGIFSGLQEYENQTVSCGYCGVDCQNSYLGIILRVGQDVMAIRNAAIKLAQNLRGQVDSRPFSPHMTIGTGCDGEPSDDVQEEYDLKTLSFRGIRVVAGNE